MCKHPLHTHNKPFLVDPVCVLSWASRVPCTVHSTAFAALLPFQKHSLFHSVPKERNHAVLNVLQLLHAIQRCFEENTEVWDMFGCFGKDEYTTCLPNDKEKYLSVKWRRGWTEHGDSTSYFIVVKTLNSAHVRMLIAQNLVPSSPPTKWPWRQAFAWGTCPQQKCLFT